MPGWSTRFASSSGSSAYVKARYKGLLKNDNQLAMLFTLANLFRVDQMIRQWERSQ
ncbi:transposase InsH for insertion sequence element IS5Y [Escherichia coli H736]|nr:transposase InsH for insertion sequence element IS5Y [Escherichia coli H736]